MPGAPAEILGNRAGHFLQSRLEGRTQALEVIAALRLVRFVGLPAVAQSGQGRGEFIDAGRCGVFHTVEYIQDHQTFP